MSRDPVDWRVAEQVATRVAARSGPRLDARTRQRLEEEFASSTPVAETLVEESTGLVSLEGPARAEVTDRAGWVRANLRSFRRLLRPILERATEEGRLPRGMPGPLGTAGRVVAGAELGLVLGWMSTRVLGQY
ncbi:MAG: zinc-dependent metalloprotease, partial [Acidimicrobiales bacterium]